jgi:hypothetical protein
LSIKKELYIDDKNHKPKNTKYFEREDLINLDYHATEFEELDPEELKKVEESHNTRLQMCLAWYMRGLTAIDQREYHIAIDCFK